MNNLEKEFIPYEQALALKQLEFDEPCLGHYQDRDETTMHGAVATSKNVHFFIGETNKRFIVRNSPISNCVLAPTFSQAFRWIRDTHNLNAQIAFCEYSVVSENAWKYTLDNPTGIQLWNGKYSTYEEAELECLKKLIDIINGKQQ